MTSRRAETSPWVVTDTYSDEGPQCPHCGRQFTADDPFYYDEMNYTEDTCDACNKAFRVSVYTSTSWSCEPVDEPQPRDPQVDVDGSRDGENTQVSP